MQNILLRSIRGTATTRSPDAILAALATAVGALALDPGGHPANDHRRRNGGPELRARPERASGGLPCGRGPAGGESASSSARAGQARRQSSISLITTLSTPSISWSLTPITSRFDVGTFLPT